MDRLMLAMKRRRNLVPMGDGAATTSQTDDLPVDEQDVGTNDEVTTFEEVAAPESEEETWHEAEPEQSRDLWGWFARIAAIAAILGWTGYFIFAHQSVLSAGPLPATLTRLVSEWAMPVLLVIGLWLLALRNSRREARRFADVATSLSHESTALEARLAVVNRELSLARNFIASQSRDIESLGRVAVERLSSSANELSGLIVENDERVSRIGEVSTTAIGNMQSLRDQLPVLTNAARDLASQIGNAGNIAEGHVEEMVEGLGRLNQYSVDSEAQIDRFKTQVSDTLSALERQTAELGPIATERFEELRRQSEAFRDRLGELEEQADGALRKRTDEISALIEDRDAAIKQYEAAAHASMLERLDTQRADNDRLIGQHAQAREQALSQWNSAISALEERLKETIGKVADIDDHAMQNARERLAEFQAEAERVDATLATSAAAFDADLERRRELFATREAEALAASEQRLGEFDAQVASRQEEQVGHIAALAERAEALASRLTTLDSELRNLGTQAEDTRGDLQGATNALAERLGQSRALLEENGAFVARLTDESVRLLELVRSGTEHVDGDLGNALERVEQRLAAFEANSKNLQQVMETAEESGANLLSHVTQAQQGSNESLSVLAQLSEHLDNVAQKSENLATHTSKELQAAINMLAMASSNMLADMRKRQDTVVREIAETIGKDSNSAIVAALRDEAANSIAELQEAAQRASEASRDTTMQLRDQLSKVNELTGNLEQRVAQARERAEETPDGHFARRMALITEALNSSAIDISKAFENEVSDVQWNNYLRGDRGVFVRRAVRLLDKQEARAIFDLYNDDGEFRETVNRYVHDFEAMLRTILSTRDGNVMAVAVLSSDAGKLYVSLAQAIERLRD